MDRALRLVALQTLFYQRLAGYRASELAAALLPAIGAPLQALACPRLEEADSPFAQVFQVITLGWATRRKVHMQHRSATSERVHEYTLSPYWIEPSGMYNTTYVIGICILVLLPIPWLIGSFAIY